MKTYKDFDAKSFVANLLWIAGLVRGADPLTTALDASVVF